MSTKSITYTFAHYISEKDADPQHNHNAGTNAGMEAQHPADTIPEDPEPDADDVLECTQTAGFLEKLGIPRHLFLEY